MSIQTETMTIAIEVIDSIINNNIDEAQKIVDKIHTNVKKDEELYLRSIPFLDFLYQNNNETFQYYIDNLNCELPALYAVRIRLLEQKFYQSNNLEEVKYFIQTMLDSKDNKTLLLDDDGLYELLFRLAIHYNLYDLLTEIKNRIKEE